MSKLIFICGEPESGVKRLMQYLVDGRTVWFASIERLSFYKELEDVPKSVDTLVFLDVHLTKSNENILLDLSTKNCVDYRPPYSSKNKRFIIPEWIIVTSTDVPKIESNNIFKLTSHENKSNS